ncbi:MAG TPA: tRNA pseudouridine(38-40) synthase TruA [Candidatus Tectomicrobia bacterium]|jgi:tRNA pseudouridine38-40 synthase
MPPRLSVPRRLKLLLAYSGTHYHGWQVQPRLRTVQGTLEACLARITDGPVRLYAAGRTDAGVHALGQVAHFDTTSAIALPALQRGLNSLLPNDIVLLQASEVSADFHARYAAQQKTYAYIVHNHLLRSVFHVPYAWHLPQPLDLTAMRMATQTLLGQHDFSAFRAAACAAHSPVRCLFRVAVKRRAARIFFVLCADGFLQHMVRNIVGTLVEIGRGHLPGSAMATILQSRQRQQAGPTAPPHGLFLVRVTYAADDLVGGDCHGTHHFRA